MVLVGAEGVVENGGVINKVGLVLPGCVAPSFPSRPVAVTLQIGTYQIAIVAQAYNTPVYVAAESYKFTRLFPLNQRDFDSSVNASLEPVKSSVEDHDYSKYMVRHLCWFAVPVHGLTGCGCGVVEWLCCGTVQSENPSCDYTPPKYISLLFTDLGVLTPSAVSDELIRLYS